MNTLELSKKYPHAFAALPEAYKNDDCLEFEEVVGVLIARPLPSQVPIIGNWQAAFLSASSEQLASSCAYGKWMEY